MHKRGVPAVLFPFPYDFRSVIIRTVDAVYILKLLFVQAPSGALLYFGFRNKPLRMQADDILDAVTVSVSRPTKVARRDAEPTAVDVIHRENRLYFDLLSDKSHQNITRYTSAHLIVSGEEQTPTQCANQLGT